MKIEGENVVRMGDMTTHNHGSPPTGAVPTVHVGQVAVAAPKDCTKALQKHPVLPHSEQQKRCEKLQAASDPPTVFQSHHVIQNAHFQYPRLTTLNQICPGYEESAAPCIALEGSSTDLTKPHGVVTAMQKDRASEYKERYQQHGTSPSYEEARSDSKKQLTKPKPGPELTDDEADCVLEEVDRQFAKMCPGKTGKPKDFKLRTPSVRGPGLPGGGGPL